MNFRSLQKKFGFLSDEEAIEIAKYMNEKKHETKQETSKMYEGVIDSKISEISVLKVHQENGYKYSKIVDFLSSKEVEENYDWLLNPNCKNRDFNAGFHSVIEKIKNMLQNIK